MQTLEVIQQMVDYHYTTLDKVWDSIMTLTDEQFAANIPYSIGSIREHMFHLANVDKGWLLDLQGIPEDKHPAGPRIEDYPTRESVRKLCAEAEKEVRDYIATLTEDDLGKTLAEIPMTVWQAILHVVNHGTDHRAQVLRALHDAGAKTFPQDLLWYYVD